MDDKSPSSFSLIIDHNAFDLNKGTYITAVKPVSCPIMISMTATVVILLTVLAFINEMSSSCKQWQSLCDCNFVKKCTWWFANANAVLMQLFCMFFRGKGFMPKRSQCKYKSQNLNNNSWSTKGQVALVYLWFTRRTPSVFSYFKQTFILMVAQVLIQLISLRSRFLHLTWRTFQRVISMLILISNINFDWIKN